MSARDWLERLRGNGRSAVVQLEPADCRELAAVLAELLDFREGVEAAAEAALDATFDLGAELQRLQARAVELTTLRAELEVMKASLKELRVSGAELQRLKDQVLELERERGEVNERRAKLLAVLAASPGDWLAARDLVIAERVLAVVLAQIAKGRTFNAIDLDALAGGKS